MDSRPTMGFFYSFVRFKMNKPQKKIVKRWALMTFIIILLMMFSGLIQDNWSALRWPTFAIIMIIALFDNTKRSHSEGRFQLNRIVEENPWVKLYLTIYLIIIAIVVNYVIYNDIILNIGANSLFLAIGLLILPIIIIQQKEAYINAGKEI